MKLTMLAVLTVLCLQSATLVQINAGSATDSNFSGGSKYTQADLATQPEPYRAMRYGPSFSYSVSLPAGASKVTLGFIEPRTAASSPAIGTGQRVFSVAINGAVVLPSLDLYVVAGSKVPYTTTFDVTQTGAPMTVQVTAASGKLAAVLSLIKVDSVDIPPTSSKTCKTGRIKVGVDITAAAQTQEIEIMSNLMGTWRWDQVQFCITERFLGQTRVTAGMGRPGTNHNEMTGTDIPLADSSGNAYCWTSRPVPGQFIGPYSVVAAFNAFSVDPVTKQEIPGDLSKLTTGEITWEACGYDGLIGNIDLPGQSTKPVVLQCSGSDAHIDPVTGKTYMADCGGLLWAKLPGISILGIMTSDIGTPTPPNTNQHWKPIR